MDPSNRRTFFRQSAAALAGSWAAGRMVRAAAPDAAGIVPQKDARLIVHTAQPPVFETPPALLAADQVTPTSLLFVRNCQQPPDVPAKDPLARWTIELAGRIKGPQKFDADVLSKLPRQEIEMVVQCSGNGRAIFSQSAPTEGTQWGRGGMGNVRFAGPRLAHLLDHLGVEPKAAARFLTASGRDDPKPYEMDFEHSLPLADVLGKSLLALELNGEPLPVIHGGPVRLVTPGYYGTMHVKWVTRLSFDDAESDHTSHMPKYRTPREPIAPGAAFEPTFDNSESNWRMRLKSVVLSPAAGDQVAAGDVAVSGVAFNDGEARIESVLLSTDRGASWQRAELDVPNSPYAWYRWRARVELPPGQQQIWSRAVDALGRSQPLEGAVFWNPRGYTWNGVEKITLTAT